MNDVIREARERALATIENHLDFIRSRVLADAVKNIGSFFVRQHLAISS